MIAMRTQVGIVGAGPAGLMLSHLLHLDGIESVILEARSRSYAEQRVRAGVLEQGVVDLFAAGGVGERMKREGLVHRGIELLFERKRRRIDFHDLTGGRCVTVYGQQEAVKDLIKARLDSGGQIVFEAEDVRPRDFLGDSPWIQFVVAGVAQKLDCDFIAGCDGFHGVCRPSVPDGILRCYEHTYPFAWLGILAEARPASEELIYAHHERGFALLSMRSPSISRLYLQCRVEEDLAEWPDDRIWQELQMRLGSDGFRLNEGRILRKGVTPVRSVVTEPMQCGRLFLAGDAAHIVPPTGAKGMNLAVADVRVLSRAIDAFYQTGAEEPLERYSHCCLRRVWKAQQFSWAMTSMLHRLEDRPGFHYRRQIAELENVTSSRAAAANLAENYVGLPIQ